MKKIRHILFFLFLFFPISVLAECCAEQGGFSGEYSDGGYAICKDETISYEPSCKRGVVPSPNLKQYVKGCTDKNAKNYNNNATIDDGSCVFFIGGCTNKDAFNYNKEAERDDGSCIPKKFGCLDPSASNYDKDANTSNENCKFQSEIEREEKITYKTQYKSDNTLSLGDERVLQKGVNGRKKVKYKVVLDGMGKEISRNKISEDIIEQATDEVILSGTKNVMKDYTVFLYGVSFFVFIFNIFCIRNSGSYPPYLLKEIQNFWLDLPKIPIFICYLLRYVLYIFYFIFIFPLYIDFALIIRNMIYDHV